MEIDQVRSRLIYSPSSGSFRWKSGKKAGCARKDGYRVIRIDGVLEYAHRLAWAHVHGKWPDGYIDHINGVKGDNRIENLREATPTLNAQNCRITKQPANKSGYRGVQANHGNWQALIVVNGKRVCLGTYKTPEDAHAVYLHAKRRLHEGCTI